MIGRWKGKLFLTRSERELLMDLQDTLEYVEDGGDQKFRQKLLKWRTLINCLVLGKNLESGIIYPLSSPPTEDTGEVPSKF